MSEEFEFDFGDEQTPQAPNTNGEETPQAPIDPQRATLPQTGKGKKIFLRVLALVGAFSGRTHLLFFL